MSLNTKSFDINKVVFEDAKHVANGNVKFDRIYMKYLHDDGTLSKLSIVTPKLFSWGVQENKFDNKNVDSYTLPLVMYNQLNGPTEEETETIEIFEAILDKIKIHLKKVYKHMTSEIDSMKIFYKKEDRAPTMYPKLLTEFRKDPSCPLEISTEFYDENVMPINPIDFIGERCNVVGTVIFDNIYIGKKPSIQLRINEVLVD